MERDEELAAFVRAIDADNIERVRKCLDTGLDINAMLTHTHGSYAHGTALHHAFEGGAHNVARFLMERGANVNVKGTYLGRTPIFQLVQAIRSGGVVLSGEDVFLRPPDPRFAELSERAQQGRLENLRLLISKGASVNVEDEHGMTPLHFTVYDSKWYHTINDAGHLIGGGTDDAAIEAAEILLQNGANVNGGRGITPLRHARLYNNHELARLFESHGGKE